MKKTALYPIIASAALLAIMGLVFCWLCPYGQRIHPNDPHWMFGRMIVGNLTGLVLGGMAVALGWRRWLSAAPWICGVFAGLVCYAATLPLINGSWGWVRFGPVAFSVWEMCPLMFGLISAWISWKLNLRSFTTMLLMAVVVTGIVLGSILTNENRVQRVKVFAGLATEMPRENGRSECMRFLANQSASIIRGAKWFGETELASECLPCAATTAMPAKATSMFGKWYLVALCVLFGLMGAGFAMAWTCVASNAKRTFILALGFSVLGTMVLSYLGCLLIVPLMTTGIAWASFGGSMAAIYWVALGVLASAMYDKEDGPRELLGREMWGIGAASVLWTILLALAIGRLQARTDIKLYEPSEMTSEVKGGAK